MKSTGTTDFCLTILVTDATFLGSTNLVKTIFVLNF